MMMDSKLVAFSSSGDFEVIEVELANQVSGGAFISVHKDGDTHVNDQCLADNQNTQCIALNNLCATDVACPEIDVPH